MINKMMRHGAIFSPNVSCALASIKRRSFFDRWWLLCLALTLMPGYAMAATFTVNSTGSAVDANTGDGNCETATPGECTLIAAIQQANNDTTQDTIEFNIPGAGPHTISYASNTLFIQEDLIIDGRTEPDYNSVNFVPAIEIENTHASGSGLIVFSNGTMTNLEIYGLAFTNSTSRGLNVFGNTNLDLTVQGCYVGIATDGTADGNTENGVYINNVASMQLGGTTAAQRNVIGSNGARGVYVVQGVDLSIVGNYIGFGPDGVADRGNTSQGIFIENFGGTVELTAIRSNHIGHNGTHGINLEDITAGGTGLIEGNFIGVDVNGDAAGNDRHGININTSVDITIGGAGGGNVIGANGEHGIQVVASSNVAISNNLVGTDSSGESASLGNSTASAGNAGIYVEDGAGTTLSLLANNRVIDTDGHGIHIKGPDVNNHADAQAVRILNNFIGVDATGAAAGNSQYGVYIEGGEAVVGTTTSGEGNIIAHNGQAGVYVDRDGADIGFATIRGNSIHSNTGQGIDLRSGGAPGFTRNDAGDADTGENGRLNYPVLLAARSVAGATRLTGLVPRAGLTVDVYEGGGDSDAGFGEGQTFIGSFVEGSAADTNAAIYTNATIWETNANYFDPILGPSASPFAETGLALFTVDIAGISDPTDVRLVAYDPTGDGGTGTPAGAVSEFGGLLTDFDDDGVADLVDIDSDGNGLPDFFAVGLDPYGDTDADQIPNFMDPNQGTGCTTPINTLCGGWPGLSAGASLHQNYNTNGNATVDHFEAGNDFDNDGIGMLTDLDADGDGIVNTTESSNGTSNPFADSNSDGIVAFLDPNESTCTNADSQPNICDMGAGNLDPIFDEDQDGLINAIDVDSDDDGIVDSIEAGHGDDSAGDGQSDGTVGANGFSNDLETSVDSGTANYTLMNTDGDAKPDFLDLDSDGDGTNDVVEAGFSADDADMNGRLDGSTDADNDGLKDAADADANSGDDVSNESYGAPSANIAALTAGARDADGDGIPDAYDASTTADTNGDGLSDGVQCALGVGAWPACLDSDNDGLPDYLEAVDQDGDGVADASDVDADNDGVTNTAESPVGQDPYADADSDGIANYLDKSDRGDGTASSCSDGDGDGVCGTDAGALFGTDGSLGTDTDEDQDGVPNHLDLDSDGDAIVDLVEAGHGASDADGDGVLPTDSVGTNGLLDALETTADATPVAVTYATLLDTDGDGTDDISDLDSDGDTTNDVDEAGRGSNDGNDDGRVDAGADVDNDGIIDTVDDDTASFGDPIVDISALDPDGDSIPTPYDVVEPGTGSGDSDSDGGLDVVECTDGWPACADTNGDGQPDYMDNTVGGDGGTNPNPGGGGGGDGSDVDTDQDGTVDSEDTDDDNDGVADTEENEAGLDPQGDGDGDGIINVLDADDRGDGVAVICVDADDNGQCDAPAQFWDFDLDGTPNHLDLDDDGDGVPTANELDPSDANADGQPDFLDPTVLGPVRLVAGGRGFCAHHLPTSFGFGLFLICLLWGYHRRRITVKR